MGFFKNLFQTKSDAAAVAASVPAESTAAAGEVAPGTAPADETASRAASVPSAAPASPAAPPNAAASCAPEASQEPSILCPVAGEAIALASVSDPVFASKVMGDGIAIKPNEGLLVAPVSGTVETLFPTGHALAIRGDDGVSVMLHIGIDTVDMKGEGFAALVSQGERVECGQELIRFDLDRIAQAGCESTTMVIVAEPPTAGAMRMCAEGPVSRGERIIWFS